MSLLEVFNESLKKPWITAGLDVQFKVIDKVLYLQCSSGKADWKNNLRFGVNVYDNSIIEFRAHQGFTDMWLSVKDKIEQLDFNVIVGYSEGAALAGFAHENFYHRKGIEPASFVFGCPRFLYKPSKELLLRFSRFSCIQNRGDIVTKVPFKFLGYSDAGHITKLHSVKRPTGLPLYQWLSGHTVQQYRLALA